MLTHTFSIHVNNALMDNYLNKVIKMHEGAEMSEDPSLRSWIFSSKGTAVMFCCYGNTLMESVYIFQSYNTDVYLIKKCICITIHPSSGITHTRTHPHN